MFETLPILAFDFGSPWLLAGLGGASIPIILHWLHRRRYRETPWAAMRFLMEATRKHSRRLRWEQWLLLAVRCLAVAALSLALSRPFFEGAPAAESSYEPRHLIIVIDDSFSMGYRVGDRSRLDEARQIARRLIESSRVGDGFSLLSLSGGNASAVLPEPTYNRETILAQLNAFQVTQRGLDAGRLPAVVRNAVASAKELRRKEVVLISDFQARDWNLAAAGRAEELQKQWTSALDGAELSLFNLNPTESANSAVTDVRVPNQPTFVGQPLQIEVGVDSWGDLSLDGRTVELIVDGKSVAVKPIGADDVAPARVSFDFTPNAVGEFRIEARLQTDSLPADNVGLATLTVTEQIRILIVEGRFSSPIREQSSHYLARAWRALNERDPSRPRVVVSRAGPLDLAAAALSQYDVIALCNLPALSAEQAARLTAFTGQGGGLLVVLGDLVQPQDWNRQLGAGLGLDIPFQIGPVASPDPAEPTVVGLMIDDLSHPIVRPFRGNPNAGLETAVIWNYFRLIEADLPEDRIVLRFENGDPAIVDISGNGRGLLVTTSTDARWGSWAPLSASFQPIAEEALYFLLQSNRDGTGTLVGEPLSGQLDPAALASVIRLRTPDDQEVELRAERTGSLAGWQYDATDAAGFYRLEVGPPVDLKHEFAVGLDASEGDLTAVPEEALKQILLAGGGIGGYRNGGSASDGAFSSSLRLDRSPVIAILLWTALVLLTVEVLLARSYLLGLYSLVGALVVGASLLLARLYSPEIGVSSGMLLGALVLLYAVRQRVVSGPKRQRTPA